MFGLSEIVLIVVWKLYDQAAVGSVLPPDQRASNYSNDFLAMANDYNLTNRVVDLFFFTQYCGPGDRIWRQIYGTFNHIDERVTYSELDECCKQHDNCPNYIEGRQDYEKYPGLEYKNQFFARLQCVCDGTFYKCLNNFNSRYASAVAIGYGIVQSFCFDFEYPIVKCSKRRFRRCEEYIVDNTKPKQWQWFSVLPAYKKIFDFPRTVNSTTDNSTN